MESAPASRRFTPALKKETAILFFVQLLSTVSFSVLYSTLVLYATKGLKLSNEVAINLTGIFIAFNYFLHLLGGFIGGRFFSYRSLFSWGMAIITIACVIIAIPTLNSLYWGTALFVAGSGLNVTCINMMITQLFDADDKRREAAFLWNYSGMNIGFFVGFMVAGWFQLHDQYFHLFLLTGTANVIALLLVVINWKHLKDINTYYLACTSRARNRAIGFTLIVVLILILRFMMAHAAAAKDIILIVGAIMAFVILYLTATHRKKMERHRMWAYFILTISSLIFWVLYQITPLATTLFIEHNVNRHLWGYLIPPQWFQNINTVILIFGCPLMAYIFEILRKRGRNINIPLQFGCALIFIGVGIAIIPLGIYLANPQGFTNLWWLVLSNVLLTMGEIFLNPIGYAMIGELAPAKLRGIFMGTWLMTIGVGAALSAFFSTKAVGQQTNPLQSNVSYSHTFSWLGWTSIIVGIGVLMVMPLIQKLIHSKVLKH